MPHNRWHTVRPSARPRPFMGGMYGGEEEFDLPALFAASAQMGNLPPEIAANAISSAVQQISAPAGGPFQDFEFDSITNEKSWIKFQQTFQLLEQNFGV